ncbi:Acg family FMN-binding oxidoreductase [Hyphobacterium sp.]|uniref:Acg family FMN-binding oxidoreductase n=1 Tax=Hyphobacterium sp. TaxID=2004662 RepID=UPI00374958B6
MESSRRRFMQILGSSAVILAAAGTGFVLTREPVAAQAPWRNAGRYPDPMRRALSWAVLAPNPHNRQPWIVDLISETEAVLYCDLERRLPETDPFDRQITIGLGCFLEIFRLAAAEVGFVAEIEIFPEGESRPRLDQRPVARMALTPGGQADPLFAHIPFRRTNRSPYDTERDVPETALTAMQSATGSRLTTGYTSNGTRRDALRSLCQEASRIEQLTPATWQESLDVMRIGRRQIEANPDGIAISGAMMEALQMAGIMTTETMADPDHRAFAESLAMQEGWSQTAMAFFWIRTRSNTRAEQIDAGSAYLRAALSATRDGLAMQPMSQSLQEYPEMAALYRDVHQELAPEGGTIQMLARLGYARPVSEAPRWPLESRLRENG